MRMRPSAWMRDDDRPYRYRPAVGHGYLASYPSDRILHIPWPKELVL